MKKEVNLPQTGEIKEQVVAKKKNNRRKHNNKKAIEVVVEVKIERSFIQKIADKVKALYLKVTGKLKK